MASLSPPRPVAVLDSAVAWTHDCLQLARTTPLSAPTPCSEWDLGDLLAHMDDSLVAIGEAAELGHVTMRDPARLPDPDRLVDGLLQRACATRAAWERRITSAPVGVEELALGSDTVVLVGALEIAVHGWDVARATGSQRTLPDDLAQRLYGVALAVVTPEDRGSRFAPRLAVGASALPSARLLAHLGRDPHAG